MSVDDRIKLYKQEKSSEERSNFNDIYQACADWHNPKAATIQKIKSKGQKTSTERLIDIGIKARRMFTAGMMSHMFPQGQNWLRVSSPNAEGNDNATRALSSVTKKFISFIEESNFYEEMGQCVDQCGYIGTPTIYCEGTKREPLVFRSYYIDSIYFCENYEGRIDTVIREFKLTARQAVQQFGDDCPQRIKEHADVVTKANKEFSFIHTVMPREGYKYNSDKKDEKPFASFYDCIDTKEEIQVSGYDELPYSIGRFYKTSHEKLGRSPASEVYATMPMINRMEVSRIRGAERLSNPTWLAPNDGSIRRISNEDGSIIYWNAGNPASKPEQLRPSDNVIVNDEMITKKEQEILDAFYVPLFNPLQDKRNMTATESLERLNLSLQFLTPAVNRLNRYFVKPTLERAFSVLLRAGHFPELEIPELSEAGITFDLLGKANLAARQIELFGTMTALEQTALIGQVDPSAWDNWNTDKTVRMIQEVNGSPVALQASEEERDEARRQRAEAQAKAEQQQAMVNASDAYAKTTNAPEEGSGAQAMIEGMVG